MQHYFQCLLIALSLCSVCRAAEDAGGDLAGLRKIVQDGAAAGRRPIAELEIFKQQARATVLAADDKIVKLRAFDNDMELHWPELNAEQLVALAAAMAETAPDHLVLLRYYVAQKLKDRAEKTGDRVLALDSSRGAEVGALLAQLPRDESKAAAPAPAQMAPRPSSARINHAGRPLPPLPQIKGPVMFDTPEADAILSALQVLPPSNAWNEDISKRPVLPDSDKMIRNVGADKPLHVDVSENFIIVPPNQALVPVNIVLYPKLSDPGPYPMPDNAPIQGWGLGKEKLEDFQRAGEGDRHVLVLDPGNMKLYEFYQSIKRPTGWEAGIEATFDLTSNKTRPKNWVSADASGMAMFPGIIKYHELESGAIEHAIRLTVSKTRKAFIYPATHLYAGHTDDPNFPAMGQRFRLKAGFDVSKLPKLARVIAIALQKYGAIVADNGADWDLCATPDKRTDYEQLRAIFRNIKGSDMEVIVTTGENEGPRAGN